MVILPLAHEQLFKSHGSEFLIPQALQQLGTLEFNSEQKTVDQGHCVYGMKVIQLTQSFCLGKGGREGKYPITGNKFHDL